MGQHITIGYLQSKMVRMPLNLNKVWNEDINSLSSSQELIDYINIFGTKDEHWRLLHAIKTKEELNKES
jgi:hypothetical protein